jgi:hypothetical protein
MSCSCGSIALDYDKLPVIPQNDHEWRALFTEWFAMLSEATSIPREADEVEFQTWALFLRCRGGILRLELRKLI